ncbi:Transcription factor atf1 [Fusarium acutatum]|uniref:Transcription factor atf1 n=1 Tax=Fusarium acutatum TaxID=78861 RepID=A0A8H4NF27_9HYPO|nr:Transcription factor atf1 [Fusarium acutatum]
MTAVFDWGIDTQNEPHYSLCWGDMPEGLHHWDWHISSNTPYNICAMGEPLISPSSSQRRENDAITGSMLNGEGLYSAPLAGSLSSTHGAGGYFQPESQIQQECLYEEATLDILQDDHESLSAATDSIPNPTLREAEAALATGVGVSASIKTRTKTVTNSAGKKRNRRKPSAKKKARRTKTDPKTEKEKRHLKILERNRRAAANCRARKQDQQDRLNAEVEKLQDQHKELSASCNELRETCYQLKLELLRHGDCGCTLIQRYIASEAVNSVENLISKHSPSSSPNCTTITDSAANASSPTQGLGGNNGWDKPHGTFP